MSISTSSGASRVQRLFAGRGLTYDGQLGDHAHKVAHGLPPIRLIVDNEYISHDLPIVPRISTQ
jgi:hypothetical protein